MEVKLIVSLNICGLPIYMVKITEENMADGGRVSVTSMKTKSLTSMAV